MNALLKATFAGAIFLLIVTNDYVLTGLASLRSTVSINTSIPSFSLMILLGAGLMAFGGYLLYNKKGGGIWLAIGLLLVLYNISDTVRNLGQTSTNITGRLEEATRPAPPGPPGHGSTGTRTLTAPVQEYSDWVRVPCHLDIFLWGTDLDGERFVAEYKDKDDHEHSYTGGKPTMRAVRVKSTSGKPEPVAYDFVPKPTGCS
jgi:hypothetical protein